MVHLVLHFWLDQQSVSISETPPSYLMLIIISRRRHLPGLLRARTFEAVLRKYDSMDSIYADLLHVRYGKYTRLR